MPMPAYAPSDLQEEAEEKLAFQPMTAADIVQQFMRTHIPREILGESLAPVQGQVLMAMKPGLFEAMDMTTVHYNALLKRWLAVYSPFGKNRLVMRSAPALTGPWSEEVEAAHARAPYTDKEYAYSGMAHPEYSRAGGRDEYLAYYRATKPWHGEIRLVRVRLAPR